MYRDVKLLQNVISTNRYKDVKLLQNVIETKMNSDMKLLQKVIRTIIMCNGVKLLQNISSKSCTSVTPRKLFMYVNITTMCAGVEQFINVTSVIV